jgi:hypothetical protein
LKKYEKRQTEKKLLFTRNQCLLFLLFIAPVIGKKNSSGSPEVASGLYIAAGYQSFDNCFRQFYAQKTLLHRKMRLTVKLKIFCYIKFFKM